MHTIILFLGMMFSFAAKSESQRIINVKPYQPTDVFVHPKLGATIEFPYEIKVVTPRQYYEVKKSTSNILSISLIEEKNRKAEEITVKSGSEVFVLNLVPSVFAPSYVSLKRVKSTRKAALETLLESMYLGKSHRLVQSRRISGEAVRFGEHKLTPTASYMNNKWRAIVFSITNGDPKTFCPENFSISDVNTRTMSYKGGSQVVYFLERDARYSDELILPKKTRERK